MMNCPIERALALQSASTVKLVHKPLLQLSVVRVFDDFPMMIQTLVAVIQSFHRLSIVQETWHIENLYCIYEKVQDENFLAIYVGLMEKNEMEREKEMETEMEQEKVKLPKQPNQQLVNVNACAEIICTSCQKRRMQVRSLLLYLLTSCQRCFLACVSRDLLTVYMILQVKAKGDCLDPIVIESSSSAGSGEDDSIPLTEARREQASKRKRFVAIQPSFACWNCI